MKKLLLILITLISLNLSAQDYLVDRIGCVVQITNTLNGVVNDYGQGTELSAYVQSGGTINNTINIVTKTNFRAMEYRGLASEVSVNGTTYTTNEDLINALNEIFTYCSSGGSGGDPQTLSISNDSLSISDGNTVVLPASGGGGSITPISKTTAELRALIASNTLENGAWYINTDYQTIYAQPDYDVNGDIKTTLVIKTGSVEPLLLFAISDSSFAPEAYSLNFPKDKLLYDINVNTTFNYGGATNSAATKGRIYERIDENNNRTDFDHRVVEFIRYDDGNGNYTVVYDNGNTTQEFLSFNVAQSFNNYFASVYPLSQFINREFGNNVFYSFLVDNEFSYSVNTNTFSGDVSNNTFSGDVSNNTFSGSVNSNTFSESVNSNTFSESVYQNTFSGYVNSNTFSGDVNTNTFTHTNTLQYVTIDCRIANKTITETLYPTLFGAAYHKEIVRDATTGDVYLKTESPSSGTPITYTIIP